MQHKLGKTVLVKEKKSNDDNVKKLTCRRLKPKRTTCLGWDSGEAIFPILKIRKALQKKFWLQVMAPGMQIQYSAKAKGIRWVLQKREKKRMDKGAFLTDVAKSSSQQERL